MNNNKHKSSNNDYNMVIFTDASFFKEENYATGSIVYRLFTPTENDKRLKVKNLVIQDVNNINEAEERLIVSSLEVFKNSYHGIDNIIIFTDSMAALKSLSSNEQFLKLTKYYNDMDIKIILNKVRSHNKSVLNNIADEQAKLTNYLVKNSKQKIPGILYNNY